MQRLLLLHVQNMIVQLFVMLPRSQRSENICMKRQKFLDIWMTSSQNSFVKKPQHANISAETRRSKIMLHEIVFRRPFDFLQESALCGIKSLKQGIRSMKDCTTVIFHKAPHMRLKLIDQIFDTIMRLGTQYGLPLGTYLCKYLLDRLVRYQFAIYKTT